jgi:outer membrane lipoprotein SlyB
MKSNYHLKSVAALATLLALGACADMNANRAPTTYPQSANSSTDYSGYGVVQAVDLVGGQSSTGITAGAIVGAVVGGVLGHQVGGGDGKTAATVIGAAGGAYAGNELEKRNQQQAEGYKFTIRMQNGSYQTVTQASHADIRVGDRVKIENGVVRRY